MQKVKIESFEFALIYATDHNKSVAFYEKYFGFKSEYKMPDGSCFGKAGNVNLWIGSDYKKAEVNEQSARLTVMFRINSAYSLFKELTNSKVKTYQDEPREMQAGNYWFQFEDPSGNIVDVLGAK